MRESTTFGHVLVLTLLLGAGLGAHAETSYRDPGDMKEEERIAMMGKTNDYNKCVYTESMANVDAMPDVRQAADEAMKKCTPIIDELKAMVVKAGFDPGFGEQFAHSAQNRVVKMLLPELALKKSRP